MALGDPRQLRLDHLHRVLANWVIESEDATPLALSLPKPDVNWIAEASLGCQHVVIDALPSQRWFKDPP